MKSIDYIKECFKIDPEANYRVQFGSEVRIYQIEVIFEDGIIFKLGDQYRLHPIGLITIEPMEGTTGSATRYPSLTLKALGVTSG